MPIGIYIRTQEHKNNLSASLKGRTLSELHKKNVSLGLKKVKCKTRFKKGE